MPWVMWLTMDDKGYIEPILREIVVNSAIATCDNTHPVTYP